MDTQTTSTRTTPVEAQIASLKWRLARAESDRDTWRVAGMQENYLGACSMVDALALQLDQLESTARFAAAPTVAIIAPTEPSAASPAGPGHEMAELCITFDGRQYGYRGYRYDRFADAVNYARLDRSRAFADPDAGGGVPLERAPAPSEAEVELMRTLGISFADGVFHWREYRYDRLADAVAYASREQAHETGKGSRSLTLRRK
jgi:hypothetical protein